MDKYFKILNPLLEKEGLTEDQIKAVDKKILEANNIATENKKTTQTVNPIWSKLFDKIAENPEMIVGLFKTSAVKYLFDFGIAVAILTALVLLALKGILGTCETSTILGGIVGYLLGKANK